jgi:hypothetical protein
MSSADGSHIAGGSAGVPRRCEVCNQELGDEQWWITRFPNAVHTRCRDWTRVAFPFARHVEVLTTFARRLKDDERAIALEASAALATLARDWPAGGSTAVLQASGIVRRVRTTLGARGVDGKLLSRLA